MLPVAGWLPFTFVSVAASSGVEDAVLTSVDVEQFPVSRYVVRDSAFKHTKVTVQGAVLGPHEDAEPQVTTRCG